MEHPTVMELGSQWTYTSSIIGNICKGNNQVVIDLPYLSSYGYPIRIMVFPYSIPDDQQVKGEIVITSRILRGGGRVNMWGKYLRGWLSEAEK